MSPSLDSLPEPSLVFSRLDLATATSLAAVSKSWRAGCEEPLCEPRWQFFLQSRWGVEATDRPREALAWLETAVRKEMARSYRRGFETMFSGGDFSLSVHVDRALLAESELFESELFWEAPARKLLLWLPLHERRRLASFVCHDSHPRASLDRVLRAFPQAGSPSPLAALRGLLLQFPFLPIDAGSGADRVIGLFSMHWLRHNPSAWASVGLDGGLPLPEARHTVYSLVYATIVLNTDLHNPAVKTKMSRAQFLTNCREAPYLQFVPERLLLETYESIRTSPLAIAPGPRGRSVSSIVRSTGDEEIDVAATLSTHSTLGPEAVAAAAAAAEAAGGAAARAPEVDWVVAYYNVLDMLRWARARVAPLHLASVVAVAVAAAVCLALAPALFVPGIVSSLH